MSFSNTPKFRKLLCVALVLVMIATCFTGCFGSSEPEDDTSEPGLNINLSNTTAAPTETEPEVPETTAPEINENTAVVTSSKNVRSSPSTEATVITTLYAGDRVEISRRQTLLNAEWAYIISPVSGWIDMEFVEMDIPTADTPSNDTSTPAGNGEVTAPTTDTSASSSSSSNTTEIKAVVNANGLYIRSEASKDGKVQGSYAKGDVITILETKNGWGRTNKGWVSMDYVTTTGNTSSSSSNNTTNSSTNSGSSSTTVTGNGSTTVQLKGVVKVNELNIRASGTTDAEKVGSYTYGTRVEILEKSGNWGRTSKGWIHLDYIYQDCTTGGPNAVSNATITGSGLNIRSGPGTNYDAVGSYNSGDIVNILAQFTFNGTTWGCTNKGWVSMKYVDTGASSSSSDSSTSTTGTTATVTADALRIRSAAGSSYTVVGSLSKGDTVTILAQQTVDGTNWGQIALGWICMDYVEVK